MKIQRISLMLLSVMIAVSCEDKAVWDLESTGPFPVVDCILTNELKNQEVQVRWSQTSLNMPAEGITGINILISDGISQIHFTDVPGEPGKYRSDVPFMAVAGVGYRLTLSKAGIADTAYAEMVGVEPFEPAELQKSDSLFRFVFRQGRVASMTEVYYNWQEVPAFAAEYGAEQAMEVFYTLDNIDPGKEFAPSREIIWFPSRTQLIRRKYSLGEAHQDFLRSLLLETEWRGGLFDAEPGNVPTNFNHGTRGWFAVCAVLADTAFVE